MLDLSPDGKLGVTLRNDPVAGHPALLTSFDPVFGTQLDSKTFGFGPLGVFLAQTSNGLRVAVLTSEGGPRKIWVLGLDQAGKLTQLGASQLTTSITDGDSGVVLSGSGQVGFVFVASSTNQTGSDLVAFSLVDGAIISKTPSLAGGGIGITEAGGKRVLASIKNGPALQLIDVTNAAQPTPIGEVPLTPNNNHSGIAGTTIAFSADGRHVFVVNQFIDFAVVDTTTLQIVSSLGGNLGYIRLRQFEDGQRRLLALEGTGFDGSGNPVLMLIDATDPTHLMTLNQTSFPTNFTERGDVAFSKDASRLYLQSNDGVIAVSLPSFAILWRQTGPVSHAHQLIVYGPADELLGAWSNLNGTSNSSVIAALPPNPPNISIADASATEGDTGTVNLDFPVTLSAPSTHRVIVSYTTVAGTAVSGTDFTAKTGALTFEPGEMAKTIPVSIISDPTDEFDETFAVNLSNGQAALISKATATGTILDNDPPPSVSISDVVWREGNSGFSNVLFIATISAVSAKPVSFDYATSDGSATAGSDYTTTSGNLSFAGGGTQRTFVVRIFGDTNVEADETFSITLSNPQNVTFARTSFVVTIVNDDILNGNPIDLNGFMIRQHYLDFLGRDPDTDGFNFWVGTITPCGSDPGCLEVQRISASVSFFLSIEFQQTGYLVERIYKSSFGDATGTSTFQSTHQLPVPIVRFSEFLVDTSQIRQGVVVLAPGWEQTLENNKQAFVNGFVARSRFVNDFPTSMTAVDFVDKLNGRAGNPLSTSERNQLVSELSSGAKTRAQVLRAIAEHQNLVSSEFNRAFVLMQYFGYLQRNPNDAPESTLDYTGYDFWLTKLNQFNGNYINAEMVKAFLSSIEYRKRFGP